MRATPSNAEIARALKEIRSLMEFAGEPFFKFMAYERAAETLENAPPAAQLQASGELQALPGIGKTIAGRIVELLETGTIAYRDELAARYPLTLLEVLGVQGIGMKTAQALFHEQGIASLADLERALESGGLDGMPRLGKKSLENIRRGILAYKGRRTRTPLGRALPLARTIVAYLEAGGKARNLTVAGSVRRAESTVGDIDIVCTSHEPGDVIARFVQWERAQAVLAEGVTKASIWLEGGLQIDLRVLPEDVFGNLLQHFTGSREHNIQLRELAIRKGLRVSENGILNLESGENLTCRTEDEVYAALGLPYIVPEMRLGIGELEAAAHEHVGAQARAGDGADGQQSAGGNLHRGPERDLGTVERGRSGRPADAHSGGLAEAQLWPLKQTLQSGGPLRVPERTVAKTERAVVHGAGWGHPDVPVATATGPVLRRRERARADDLDARHGAVITMRTGVGSKPLQGLLICGQLETTTTTSISARRSRYRPGAEMPSTIPSVPSGSTGTFMYQLTLGTRSRLPSPHLAPSARKFSTHACWWRVW